MLRAYSPQHLLRVEGLKPSLTAPYLGPLEVLSRTDQHLTVKRNDRTTTINNDRLNPAFLLNNINSAKEPFLSLKRNNPVVHAHRLDSNVPVSTTTRSGRKVRFNPKFL
ncbi:hypothetical protein NPIL_78921 [Nephila pilipes]|uniref:Uncharacterized protein n=1 Tax=Nephila pilipes TaxID=299642 RepID=A0A8X6U8K7_NEPPI|nr:hypothetical protein NPIL_78921 [Nephila pilipes]